MGPPPEVPGMVEPSCRGAAAVAAAWSIGGATAAIFPETIPVLCRKAGGDQCFEGLKEEVTHVTKQCLFATRNHFSSEYPADTPTAVIQIEPQITYRII